MHAAPSTQDPHPIDEPKAYQDLLVGFVGDDDPAAVQAATPGQIRALLAEAGTDGRTRPEPKEWSVLECVAHIADAEIVYAGRYRWILAHDQPELIGYDQDLWVNRLHQPVEEPAQLLALFEPLRQANLDLWARTPIADRARVGLHRERGPESFALSFTLIAGHDRLHLAQARRALELVSAAG
ncbi:MAG TPA: DinB family protein [Candidatus Limnocylindria bacterium]|nr:DinB family protein [Candidatus Limnocylindria bacterium]